MDLRLPLIAVLLLAGVGCSTENDLGNIDTDETDDTDPVGVPGEPVAVAGDDQLVAPLSFAQLDGQFSYDPGGGTIVDYQWTLTQKPAESHAVIFPGNSARPVLEPDVAGSYVCELTVQNNDGKWDSSPDQMTVEARPIDGFYVELTWNTAGTDLDLHIIEDPAPLWDANLDCNFCNRAPEWGLTGELDNPKLLHDEQDGYGPETTAIQAPSDGDYRIAVQYFGTYGAPMECIGGCPPTVATVKLFLDGVETNAWSRSLTKAGDVWEVSKIAWPTKIVTATNTVTPNTTHIEDCW